MTHIAFGQPGWFEILIVLLIALLLFGSKKLPELARSLGKSIQEFKKGKDDVIKELTDTEPPHNVSNDNHEASNHEKSV